MNEFVYIGKVSNTHGIKGEIRIKSDFEKKSTVFQKGFKIYLGKNKECEIIDSYRVHKEYDMVTFKGKNNINDVIQYKQLPVYVRHEDLKLNDNEYVLQDLIGFSIIEDEKILGKVIDFMYNSSNILLEIEGNKHFYIPYNKAFIKKVDVTNKIIEVINSEGLII